MLNGNLRSIFTFLKNTLLGNIKLIYQLITRRTEKQFEDSIRGITLSTRNKRRFILITTLMWFLASTVLARSLSSLLFNMYFRPIPVKIVNSLEDIANNPNLKVYGKVSFDYLKTIEKKAYKQLEDRVSRDEADLLNRTRKYNPNSFAEEELTMNNINTILMKNIVYEIMKGEAVIFLKSHNLSQAILNYAKSDLVPSDSKYGHSLMFYHLNKKHSQHKRIRD